MICGRSSRWSCSIASVSRFDGASVISERFTDGLSRPMAGRGHLLAVELLEKEGRVRNLPDLLGHAVPNVDERHLIDLEAPTGTWQSRQTRLHESPSR